MKLWELYTTLPAEIMRKYLVRNSTDAKAKFRASGTKPAKLAPKGRKWTTGNAKALKASAAYPDEFCLALVQAALASKEA